MNCDLIEVNVTEVHHKVFSHKCFKLGILYDIKLAVVFETAQQVIDGTLIVIPILFEALHLNLSFR